MSTVLTVCATLVTLGGLFVIASVLGEIISRRDQRNRADYLRDLAAQELTRVPASAVAQPPAQPLPRTCVNCARFDLAEGQAAIAQFPTFMRVASVISPAQINRKVAREFDRPCKFCGGSKTQLRAGDGALEQCRGCEGTGLVHEQELSTPGAPEKARWNECGACMKDEVVVWGGDQRDCFEAKAS